MLTDNELWEKCNNNQPITANDLGIKENTEGAVFTEGVVFREATKEERESVNKYIKSISEPVFTKEQLKQFYEALERMSFKVDMGHTEIDAVRLVDIEDIIINQFK